MQFYCQSTIRPKKDTKLCLRVEKWSRSVQHLFLIFTQSLLNPPFWVVFVYNPSMCLFFHDSICAMCRVSSSTNNFAHAQTLSRMSSLSGCMNIARVNIGFFTGFKKIKQRRISFVLVYLRMILWKISPAISNIGNF